MTFTRLLTSALAATLFCLTAFSHAQASDLKITEMAVTTKIVKGNPIDSVWRISSSSVKALYCFTRIVAPKGTDTTIKHVWYLDGKVVHEDEMPVKGSHWRTYSSKDISKGMSGDWRCEAQDEDGKVLKAVTFKMNGK